MTGKGPGKGPGKDSAGSRGLISSTIGADDFGAAFGVSRETAARLSIYAELLVKWQKTINLVAPSTLDDIWLRHFADSAQLLALAPAGAERWVDLGSGAGFPGVVLAILQAEKGPASFTLLESDTRKCAFLAEVVRKTGLASMITVEIVNDRIEKAAIRAKLSAVDVVTARALAPLDRLLGLSAPLFSGATVGLFLKGRDVEAEIAAAKETWHFDFSSIPSRTDAWGRIIAIRNLEAIRKG